MVVEPGNCFWALMDYLNPVRAGMVKEDCFSPSLLTTKPPTLWSMMRFA